eukprot:3842696-Pyramimonas_sp.AAC.1
MHPSLGQINATYATACSYMCCKGADRKPKLLVQVPASWTESHGPILAKILKWACAHNRLEGWGLEADGKRFGSAGGNGTNDQNKWAWEGA